MLHAARVCMCLGLTEAETPARQEARVSQSVYCACQGWTQFMACESKVNALASQAMSTLHHGLHLIGRWFSGFALTNCELPLMAGPRLSTHRAKWTS